MCAGFQGQAPSGISRLLSMETSMVTGMSVLCFIPQSLGLSILQSK